MIPFEAKKNAEALRMEVETLVNMASTKNKNCHKKKLGAKKSWSWTYFHRFLSIFHIRPITHTVPFECMIKMKWQYGKSKSNKMHGSNWRNKIKTEYMKSQKYDTVFCWRREERIGRQIEVIESRSMSSKRKQQRFLYFMFSFIFMIKINEWMQYAHLKVENRHDTRRTSSGIL